MAASIREQIVAYMASALGTVAGAGVYRSRQSAVDRLDGPAILVQPKDERVENRHTGIAIRDLTVEIVLIYRSDTPDSSADATIQSMASALTRDQTLGGLADRIIEDGTEWRYEEADLTAMEVSLIYRVRYMTPTQVLSNIA